MTEAHCLTKKSDEKTAVGECRTIRELPAGHDPKTPPAVPAHLSLLRDALACGKGRNTRTHAATRADRSHTSPRHRRPHRALTTQLTLSQWVNRTTSHIR